MHRRTVHFDADKNISKDEKKGVDKMALDHKDFCSFGALLKAFRKRIRLTQQQVATAIGVHRNAIGRWEQGDFLPESKGMVLDLAKQLRLDDQETRQLLEASLTALVPYWHLPYPRNLFFTGREEILDTLYTYLRPDQAIALIQSHAMYGLGGVGKTQFAVEYAYRYALEYRAVFWISSESIETITASFLHIADLLKLPECKEADQQRIVLAVQRWLVAHKEWLLIWDNLEDLELLRRYMPLARQGSILITTRCQALGTLAQSLELSMMTVEEGILFLLRRGKILSSLSTSEHLQQFVARNPNEYTAAQVLVELMGGLPLALDQAGAYIEESGCSLATYLSFYKQQQVQLLARRGTSGGNHPDFVVTTFSLIFKRIEQDYPTAVELLRMCVFLHAEVIPDEIFVMNGFHTMPELDSMRSGPSQFDQAMVALRTFSLVQRHTETHTFSIHRLIQAALEARIDEQERVELQRCVIRILNNLFPEAAHETWAQCERLLSHVLACVATIQHHVGSRDLADVLRKAADYLRDRAQYEQSEALYQRALCVWEQILGSEDADVAYPLNGLALLYYNKGKYEQAEPLYQRALHIHEQALGPEDPLVASTLNNLALLYYRQGKYEQAEPLYQRALHIHEQALGPEDPLVASTLNNLAFFFFEQGKYEQAEQLSQRALHICEQICGPEDPLVAQPLYCLANFYVEQEKYEQAEPLYQRALHICEQALGPEHPNLSYSLIGLADLYREQEKYEQAEPLYQRALSIRESSLGPEHPLVAGPFIGLATFYREQGKYEQAKLLYQRALSIYEQALGPEHPKMAYALDGLAILYYQQGKYKEVEPLLQRSLALRQQHLSSHHPEVAETLHHLGCLHQIQQQTMKALLRYRQALMIREQTLGRYHSKTVKTRNALFCLLKENGLMEKEVITEVQILEGLTLCACGCGREIDTSKSRGEPKRFFSIACKQRFYRNATQQKRNAIAEL